MLVMLGIWGVVLYRSLNNYFFTSNTIATSSNMVGFSLKKNEKDSFALRPLLRNPFTNRVVVINEGDNKSNRINKASKKATVVSPVTTSLFKKPSVPKKSVTSNQSFQFIGTIKNQSKGEMVILRINNEIKHLYLGVKQEDYLIKKIYKDSVVLFTNGEKIIVKKRYN